MSHGKEQRTSDIFTAAHLAPLIVKHCSGVNEQQTAMPVAEKYAMHGSIHPYLAAFFLLCLLLANSQAAHAVAPWNYCSSSELPLSTIMSAKVDPNLSIGDPIPGSDVSTTLNIFCEAASDADTVGCTGGGGWALTANSFTPGLTGVPNTYTFPGLNAGLGFQVMGIGGTPLTMQDSGTRHFFITNPLRPVDGWQVAYARFRLVKIADTVTAGTAPTPKFYMACNDAEYANIDEARSLVNLSAVVEIVSSTCRLVIADTQVTLPTLTRGAFDGVGSRKGSTAFNLDFQCDADASAQVFFTDITDQANAGPTFKPVVSSTAGGVGIQLTSAGTPVTLVPNQSVSQGGQTFPLSSPGSAQVISIPLAAEYVQTATPVTSGSIQAQALVTISYL